MKEEKDQPAKVIGKVDLKKDWKKKAAAEAPDAEKDLEKAFLEDEVIVETDANGSDLPLAIAVEAPITETEPESEDTGGEKTDADGATDSTTSPDPSAADYVMTLPASLLPIAVGGDSLKDTIEGYAEQDKADAGEAGVLSSPEAPKPPTARPTFKQKVAYIVGVVVGAIVGAFDRIGLYLLDCEFGGDYEKALKKDPYKDTSLTELARDKDMPFTRQKLAECLRAAAVGKELENLGQKYDSLDFYKRVELSRVKNQGVRLKLAKKALDEHLTVKMVRNEVKKLSGKKTSSDSRLGKTVLKHLGELARLSVDEDTKEFLLDKDRLKAALSHGERGDLLEYSEKFRETNAESQELLKQLENNLVEIFKETKPAAEIGETISEEEPESAKAHETVVSGSLS
jgi:hypothetical protein